MKTLRKHLLTIIWVVLLFIVFTITALACYVPPQELCLDDAATNYQGQLPCEYPEEPEVTPEPTREPEQPQGNPPTFQGSTTDAPPAKVCTIPFTEATIWYEGDQFKWATDVQGIEKFAIVYGPTPDQLIYGIDNIPATARSIEINRPDWKQTWFQVWIFKDGCAEKSLVIDP